MKTVTVILAGGRSSRMGTDKALLPVEAGGAGRGRLVEKEQEWRQYVTAVEQVLRGGECLA